MKRWQYSKGLQEIGNGVYAYLQPDGSWGLSNAGLVVDGKSSLLVDTLFDLVLTREMLDEMKKATDAAASIDTLVITHANGDHYYGNQLVKGAEIISSTACAEEMNEMPPQMLAQILKAASGMGDVGEYFIRAFSKFKFDDIVLTPPTRTFTGRLEIKVGKKDIELIEVGPAHTKGDIIVHVPDAKTVFTGDILFIDGTPIMWAGPVANWIRACERISGMDVEAIVPGHGPITDRKGVDAVKEYLEYIQKEARKRYEAGMSASEASWDIALGDYSSWGDPERIVINVHTLYREFSGDQTPPNVVDLFSQMARLEKKFK